MQVRLSDAYQSGLIRAHVMITIAPKALSTVTAELNAIREVSAAARRFELAERDPLVRFEQVTERATLRPHLGGVLLHDAVRGE